MAHTNEVSAGACRLNSLKYQQLRTKAGNRLPNWQQQEWQNGCRAWVESWENENGKDKSDTAKAMFRKKYVGMKLRVEGEEEGEE